MSDTEIQTWAKFSGIVWKYSLNISCKFY